MRVIHYSLVHLIMSLQAFQMMKSPKTSLCPAGNSTFLIKGSSGVALIIHTTCCPVSSLCHATPSDRLLYLYTVVTLHI